MAGELVNTMIRRLMAENDFNPSPFVELRYEVPRFLQWCRMFNGIDILKTVNADAAQRIIAYADLEKNA